MKEFIFNIDQDSIDQRIEFAQKYKFCFADIIQQTRRNQDTAKDRDLNIISLNNILSSIKDTEISYILLTCSSNANSVKSLFSNYLLNSYNINLDWNSIETNDIGKYFEAEFIYNNRNYILRT